MAFAVMAIIGLFTREFRRKQRTHYFTDAKPRTAQIFTLSTRTKTNYL